MAANMLACPMALSRPVVAAKRSARRGSPDRACTARETANRLVASTFGQLLVGDHVLAPSGQQRRQDERQHHDAAERQQGRRE